LTVEDQDITALLDALCERPLADAQTEPPAELLALCRKAATVLLQACGREADDIADTDRVTAALAEMLSGDNTEKARHIIEVAAAKSAAVRLDVQSALAFVDAVEQSPQSAPMHLVDEMLAADHTGSTRSTAPFASSRNTPIWSLPGSSWSVRRWRIAAACAILFVTGVASWSVWQRPDPAAEGSLALPAVKTTSEPPAVAASPAPPPPKLATPEPCKPLNTTSEASKAPPTQPTEVSKAAPSAEIDCASPPGHQFADRPTEEIEAIAARARLEAERQAAAERAAAEAAGKIGAGRAGDERGSIAADRVSPLNGMPGRDVPAAASSVPSAPPSYGIAPPAAAPAGRPNPAGR
jgi:hypothetical protein